VGVEERISRLQRDLRLIRRYAAGVTLLLVVLPIAAFQQAGRTRFTELDVERLNVVEKDGRLRLAIATPDRMPPITFKGKEYPGLRGGSAPGMAGMIYFNEEGTEAGGFGWRGRKTQTGHSAAGLLTFDQYNQGEALALWYADESGRRQAGLVVYDQPEGSAQAGFDSMMVFRQIADSAERARRVQRFRDAQRARGEVSYRTRLYLGKDRTKAAMVRLDDPQGRPRLRLSVDSLGAPKLEFLDENGKVTHALPGGAR
jgi:hypothetical protein